MTTTEPQQHGFWKGPDDPKIVVELEARASMPAEDRPVSVQGLASGGDEYTGHDLAEVLSEDIQTLALAIVELEARINQLVDENGILRARGFELVEGDSGRNGRTVEGEAR